MKLVPKAEMLTRVGLVVKQLRFCSAYCGSQLVNEVEALEQMLSEIETMHAETVDIYMAGLYRQHNKAPLLLDLHGITIGRRWNKERMQKWDAERQRQDQAQLLERILPA